MLTPPLIGVHKNKNGVNETRNNKRCYKKDSKVVTDTLFAYFALEKEKGEFLQF